nr:CAP domain-containing protein [uncultured Holophaga sp.]
MLPLPLAFVLLLAAGESPGPRPPDEAVISSQEEQAVVLEINRIRKFPRAYAAYLKSLRVHFDGTLWRLPGRIPIRTQEGVAALDGAVAFLESVPPREPLSFSERLFRSSLELVREQGPTGQTGHRGPGGSTLQQRILRQGPVQICGEIINYGPEQPRMTMLQLVIDDGVPDRGHRKNLFDPEFHIAGAAIGAHKVYGSMTVVDLADGFAD